MPSQSTRDSQALLYRGAFRAVLDLITADKWKREAGAAKALQYESLRF
jgi:hypothetical protein